ncbi:MAG: Smr/MutS family protein [Pseudomonadales bacterium]|nr:Smr/MutS family protein [Pseudomonadales bacterium]
MKTLDCLFCGMQVARDAVRCPKCDQRLADQTDGHMLTEDIAHQHETVAQAMRKFARLLAEADLSRAAAVRLIVGTGLIRERVLEELSTLQHRGEILAYDTEGRNQGSVVVTLRQR